ncbi:hypothetical protein N9W70_04965 [Schleiferiaceae bacterium]|nr:hypothetical protein [Schleiferiaceae bacterium]
MRQTINISIFGLFVILMSCKRKSAEQSVSNNKEEFKFPVIVDTSGFKTSKREATWLSTANYELLYIGEWKDTIYPDYSLKYYPIPPPPPPPSGGKLEPSDTIGYHKRLTEHKMYPYYIDWMAPANYKSWRAADISIKVDTTQRIKNDDIHANWDDPFFEAYPVLIENKENDTITIAYGHFVPLITEAKDSTGNWRPIEKEWQPHGWYGMVILPPTQIGLSATMIYHGNYSTTLRLRIDSTFSNEFKGNINYRQFESMFNDQGDYKEEYKKEMKK